MSRFKQGDLIMGDGNGVFFGADLDASIIYDNATDTLVFDATTFSGLPAAGVELPLELEKTVSAESRKITLDIIPLGQSNATGTISGTNLYDLQFISGQFNFVNYTDKSLYTTISEKNISFFGGTSGGVISGLTQIRIYKDTPLQIYKYVNGENRTLDMDIIPLGQSNATGTISGTNLSEIKLYNDLFSFVNNSDKSVSTTINEGTISFYGNNNTGGTVNRLSNIFIYTGAPLGIKKYFTAVNDFIGLNLDVVNDGQSVNNHVTIGPTASIDFIDFTQAGGLRVNGTVVSIDGHTHDYAPSDHNHEGTYATSDHNHDDLYYTEGEVDTISGALNDSKANTNHTHTTFNYGAILTDDTTYTGEIMTVSVGDSGAVFGSVLYQAYDFAYNRANAGAFTSTPAYVMALESGDGTKTVLIKGQVCYTTWDWVPGKVYLSKTSGEMTQTLVSGTTDQVQILGYALSADTIMFNPNYMVLEV